MRPSISVAVPHAKWVSARAASVERIRRAISVGPIATWAAPKTVPARGHHEGLVSYHEETHRGPMWEWHARLWTWAFVQPVSHCLFLADDTILAPHAIEAILAMIEARPAAPLGLTSQHPAAAKAFRDGCRWYRSSSPWLVGWAYVLPREMLGDFLYYRAGEGEDFRRGELGGDDQQINRFLAASGISTWHPLPTVVDHDLRIGSEYDHPTGDARREASTKAPWTLESWRPSGEPTHKPAWTHVDYWRAGRETVLECPPSEQSWREWEAAR
jgi:hypothetical protein